MPKRNKWADLLETASQASGPKVVAQRRALLEEWSLHPLNWLCARDPTTRVGEEFPPKHYGPEGRPLIYTTDERSETEPVKPFPSELPHVTKYIEILHDEPFVIVDKPRQMYISTATLLFMDWHCRFRPSRRWLFSKRTEDEAKEMLKDKLRAMHARLPAWVRQSVPLAPRPAERLNYLPNDFGGGGGYILAVAENVADSHARGGTASGVFVDEGAFQDHLEEIIGASLPMCDKVVMVSTAEYGTPGATTFQAYLNEGLEER